MATCLILDSRTYDASSTTGEVSRHHLPAASSPRMSMDEHAPTTAKVTCLILDRRTYDASSTTGEVSRHHLPAASSPWTSMDEHAHTTAKLTCLTLKSRTYDASSTTGEVRRPHLWMVGFQMPMRRSRRSSSGRCSASSPGSCPHMARYRARRCREANTLAWGEVGEGDPSACVLHDACYGSEPAGGGRQSLGDKSVECVRKGRGEEVTQVLDFCTMPETDVSLHP